MDIADLCRRSDIPDDVRAAIGELASEVQRLRQAQLTPGDGGASYREVIEHANSVVLRMDLQGRVTYWNSFAERLFGFSREQILGRSVIGTIVPEMESSGRDLRTMIADLTAHPDRFASNENENVTKDGRRVWVAWTNRGECDAAGTPLGVWCIGNDITQRKRMEEALRVQRDFGSALAAASELTEALKAWLHAGLAVAPMEGGVVHCANPESGALALVAAAGLSRPVVEAFSLLTSSPDGASPRLPSSPVYVRRGEEVGPTGAHRLPEGVGALVCVPLRHDGEPIAWLTLASSAPVEVSPPEQGALDVLAAQMEGAMGRLRAEARVRQLNRELRKRASDLAAANRELEAFAYSVSHDLRTPVRAIDGFSRALLDDYGDRLDETGRHYLTRLRANAQRMGRLIDDLLSLSRIGRHEVRRRPVDLTAQAREVVNRLRASAPDREVEFVAAEGLVVEGDGALLQIVLENLLGNAWKFTSRHPRARVELGVTELDGERVFFVRDDGAGFDMAYAERLFAPFQRLHSESEFEGTGIGLATVQRIIRRHGGRIWAESEVENGATFYFTL